MQYQSIRIPVIQTSQYTVYLQSLRINDLEYTFVHCDVMESTVVSLRNLRMDWNTFVDLHNGPLLALSEHDDEKHQHFLELFDFTYLQDLLGDDEVLRKLYVHNNGHRPSAT